MLCFLLVLSNEIHELCLIINHKHLLHVPQSQTVIGALCRACNLISNCISELANEKVVSDLGHVLLLLENFLVAALDEVRLETHWHLDVDVSLDILLGDQLNLRVVL